MAVKLALNQVVHTLETAAATVALVAALYAIQAVAVALVAIPVLAVLAEADYLNKAKLEQAVLAAAVPLKAPGITLVAAVV